MSLDRKRPSIQDLEAEAGTILPAKEVLSVPLLDLNIDVDLALALLFGGELNAEAERTRMGSGSAATERGSQPSRQISRA